LASVRHRKNRMEEAARTAIHPALDPRHIRDVTRCHAHDEGVAHVKHAPDDQAEGIVRAYFFRSLPMKSRFPSGTPFQRRMSYVVVA